MLWSVSESVMSEGSSPDRCEAFVHDGEHAADVCDVDDLQRIDVTRKAER